MDDDYIDLGPEDILRDGDQQRYISVMCGWFPVHHERIGFKATSDEGWIFRRPRSTLIRDAAIHVCKLWYAAHLWNEGEVPLSIVHLREVIGISIEELRGEA